MEALIWNTVITLETWATLREEFARCNRGIAAARKALLTGSVAVWSKNSTCMKFKDDGS
jgi:hypothetical protein